MVTIAPKEKGWSDVGEAFGTGFVSSYQNRSDELAIQDAVSRLPENATMKERLAAITGAKTYNPKAKQDAITNFMKAGKYESEASDRKSSRDLELAKSEEMKRHHMATEATANAKAAAGGGLKVSEKPLGEEATEALYKVTNTDEFKNADDTQQRNMLNKAKIPKGTIDSVMKDIQEAKKTQIEADKFERNIALSEHNASDKYASEIDSNRHAAQKQRQVIKDVSKSVDKVKPTDVSNILSFFGAPGQALANAFMNKDQAVFKNAIPTFLEGAKELFGVRLSDADLKILADKLPDIGKSPEANKMILKLMDKYAYQSELRGKIMDDITSKTKFKYRPIDIQAQVNKRFEESVKPVRMRLSPTDEFPEGEEVYIEAYRIPGALQQGAMLIND